MIVIFIIYENSADAKTTWYGILEVFNSVDLFYNFQFSVFSFQFSVFEFKLSIFNMTRSHKNSLKTKFLT